MKQIEGYENYSVTEDGRVWSKSSKKFLNPHCSTRNYKQVALCLNGKVKRHYIHRLVAQAYIPNPENKPQVNHLDKNPLNNNVSNLEWCTSKENHIHAWENGRTVSEETRFKLSLNKLGNSWNTGNSWNKGKKRSKESCLKQSETMKQKKPV